MSMRLAVAQSVTLLPNPDFGDSEGHNVEVNYLEAASGRPYAYKKTTGYRNLEYTWTNLGRGKIEELVEFFKLYIGEEIIVEDQHGVSFRCVLNEDPVSFSTDRRSAPLSESGTITLRFSGVKL